MYIRVTEADTLRGKPSLLTCLQRTLSLLQVCPRQASRSGAHVGVSGPASFPQIALHPGRPGAGSRAGPAGLVSGPPA